MYYTKGSEKVGVFTVAKVKLNYKFNNPNTLEDTAEMLLKIFIEVNGHKIDEALKEIFDEANTIESHPV